VVLAGAGRLDARRVGAVVSATIAGLVSQVDDAEAIAVDIPVGLPTAGPRAADRLAYAFLGPRRASIFVTPVRPALEATSFRDANRLARELTGAGISRQAYALRRKILEVERWRRSCPKPVYEGHPELSFALLADAPLGASKKSWTGMRQRLEMLARVGIELPADLGPAGVRAGADDVLDAAVLAWTARRIQLGQAVSFPSPPEDLAGVAAAIWG
jgi:predicted RNase H-like nuclease